MKSVIFCLQFLTVLLGLADAQYPPPGPKPKGLKISWVGHSFHVYLPKPVSQLATEAGIVGHVSLNTDMIGASQPCQHWTKGGGENGTNTVKDILKAAKADVMTMSLQQPNPDPCVPKFARLANQYKKDMRLMIQETWLPNSANPEEQCVLWGCKNRDAATVEGLEKTRQTIEIPFQNRMRWQLDGLNREIGTNFTTFVPVWEAVLKLRQLIAKGEVPGITKQSALFRDNLGHATPPLVHMTSYLWFAALYNINPIGSKVLGGDPAQEAIFQKLAWETILNAPLNGFGTVPGEAKGYKPLPPGAQPPPLGALPAGFPSNFTSTTALGIPQPQPKAAGRPPRGSMGLPRG